MGVAEIAVRRNAYEMLRVRNATLGDADAIARIHVASWRATYIGVLVAEAGHGALQGFASAFPDADNPGQPEVRTLYLEHEVQRRGIGRALLDKICARIAARGHCATMLRVGARNSVAIRFCLRQGWKTDGTPRPMTIGSVETEVLRFTRTLRPPS
ncbi:MAG: GNAT family N-acetyltransferase [Acidimicrobiia bacterium]